MKYTQTIYLAVPLAVSCLLLALYDVKKKNLTALTFFIPWIFQCLVITFIPQFFPHYLIPGLIFFLTWVLYKRSGQGRILSYLILTTLILGGVFSIFSQLTKATSIPTITVAREVERNIKKEITAKDLKNVNIAVLGSLDQTTSGKKYRDLLLVDGNTHILTKDEYIFADHLFVVSTSSEAEVRLDPAAEMHRFRKGPLVDMKKIGNSDWFVYHFTRGI